MKNHYLKTIPPYFQHVMDGRKTFEYRKNDRGFQVGDTLILKEFADGYFTGRSFNVQITYILQDAFNIPKDYAILAIKEVRP